MMHLKAKLWDKEHGIDKAMKPSTTIRPHRPYDWCGRIVVEGFIHARCTAKENEAFLSQEQE
jgi:hypothetical protein